MNRGGLAALLVAVISLVGCTDGTADDEQARQQAGIHRLAQELVDRTGVVCAEGGLDTQGLPTAPSGSLYLTVTADQMPAPDQEQLLRDTAQELWESDLSVSSLSLDVRNGTELPVTIGQVLGSDVSFVRADDLERAFGARPPVPTPLPALDDPGNPAC